jgi:hypothetical protein
MVVVMALGIMVLQVIQVVQVVVVAEVRIILRVLDMGTMVDKMYQTKDFKVELESHQMLE